MSTVPKVEIEVKYDKTTQTALLKQAPTLSQKLASVKPKDQRTVDLLREYIAAGMDWLAQVDAIMDPVRDATHKAWKAAIKAQDDFKAPVEGVLKAAKKLLTDYLYAQEQARQQKQLEADARQREENDRKAKDLADKMRKAGADKEAIEQAKESVKATPAPIVEAKAEAPTGTAIRELWDAEVVNKAEFIRAAAANPDLQTAIEIDQSTIRGWAKERKEAFNVPGLRAFKKPSGAFRGQ